ncbi:MAG: WD40 domain-containing protein, partial [archaeon]|nr:WD40 domain-containing protein [archaeon]
MGCGGSSTSIKTGTLQNDPDNNLTINKNPTEEVEIIDNGNVEDWDQEEKAKDVYKPKTLGLTLENVFSSVAHDAPIITMSYIEQNEQIATGGVDNLIKIWNRKGDDDNIEYVYYKTLSDHQGNIYFLKNSVEFNYL